MVGAPLDLGRHRLGRVVRFAQTAVHACPKLGFRPVCLHVVHESVMTQNHSGRMRRLAASGLLPERAGQPVKVWAHVSLAELRALDDGSVLETEWVTEMRIRWSARRA